MKRASCARQCASSASADAGAAEPLSQSFTTKNGLGTIHYPASFAAWGDERGTLQVMREKTPTLTLVYLPHLDYDLQRLGPNHAAIPAQVAAVDAACAPLIEQAQKMGDDDDVPEYTDFIIDVVPDGFVPRRGGGFPTLTA